MSGVADVILVRGNRKLLENSCFNRIGMKKSKSIVRPGTYYEGTVAMIKVYIVCI
jgi:hypothetical protein